MDQRNHSILRSGELSGVDRGQGVSTVPLATRQRGSGTFLTGVTTFERGASLPVHFHNCVESVYVLTGAAVVEIDGELSQLQAGDATIVSADIPHRFINDSSTGLTQILWVYGSADATRTVVGTGITVTVEAEQQGGPAVDG